VPAEQGMGTMSGSHEVEVQIKVLAHGEGLPLPELATAAAAGADLVAAIGEDAPVRIEPGKRMLIPTGLAMALPAGFEAQVRPRSGLALKHGVSVLNAPGTIDADYRGEVGVILINHGPEPFVVTRGMRIAQIVVAPVWRARFTTVGELSETGRATGGFGSTGTQAWRT